MASTGESEIQHTASMAPVPLPTTTSSSGIQGTRSNNIVPSPPQPKVTIYKPSYPVPDRGPRHTTKHEIHFLHSGYMSPFNLLLRLYAFDAVESGQTGLYAHTAWLACAIMACNAWNGYLVVEDGENGGKIVDNLDIILLGKKYSFRVPVPPNGSATQALYQYPICPSFKEWLFPHGKIASIFSTTNPEPIIQDKDIWSHYDNSYRDATEVPHLVPQKEFAWFLDQHMLIYIDDKSGSLAGHTDSMDDVSNIFTLRSDVQKLFEDRRFAFVPKCGKWVAHFLGPTYELGPSYHNTEIRFHPLVSTAFLLARLAYSILPLAAVFLSTPVCRTVQVRGAGVRAEPRIEHKPGEELYRTYCDATESEITEEGSSTTSVRSDLEVENYKRKCLPWLIDTDDSFPKEAIATNSPPLSRSTMPTLSYGLNITKKDPSLGKRPSPTKRKTIFDDDDDSGPENNPDNAAGAEEINVIGDPTPSSPSSKPYPANTTNPSHTTHHPTNPKPPISQNSDLSTTHTSRQHASMATAIDASIYDYDAIYDTLHAPAQSRTSAAGADRKPKYMGALLAAADVRKRDQLRAKDKMLVREREAEGEEFVDKEKFVTGAYKAQQAEVARLEAEESRREEEEARRGKGLGMVGFYKGVLERGERRHEEVVKAAEEGGKGGGEGGSGIAEVMEEGEKSEAAVARDLNALGQGIVVNDDGQVVDKRQLLSAGLNVAPKPKAVASAKTAGSSTARPGAEMHFQGRGGSKQAMRERQTRMLEAQLEQVTKRAADDEEEQKEELERAAKSRKTEGEISGARERYLQRKMEAASAKAP